MSAPKEIWLVTNSVGEIRCSNPHLCPDDDEVFLSQAEAEAFAAQLRESGCSLDEPNEAYSAHRYIKVGGELTSRPRGRQLGQ